MKLKAWGIGFLAAIIVVAAFLLPVVPTVAAAAGGYSTSSSSIPPLNVGILTDPTGTYQFTYYGNGTYSMNTTAYYKLLGDPYTGISATSVRIEGNTVLLTLPISNTESGTTSSAPSPPVSTSLRIFESAASWLLGCGAFYGNGNYHLGFK